MKLWQRVKNIQIPGPIVAGCLTGVILGTTTALFTLLPVKSPTDNTSDASTSGKNESLDVRIKLSNGEELHLKATGVTTMGLVQSFQQMLNDTDENLLLERYYPYTPPQVE
jgi:hypothetical protein